MTPEIEALFAAADLATRPERMAYDGGDVVWKPWDLATIQSFAEPATAVQYAAWLSGYLKAGGQITQVYESPMPSGWMWMLTRLPPRGLELDGGCSQLPAFIVPAQFDWSVVGEVGDLVFCHLYTMADFYAVGVMEYVPLWSDVRAELALTVEVP